ncbi:ATP-binding protein [Nonomuraea sp. SYSU D8015]|uniref:ATP-binding protein n=1 Tax=Nonomuraea sp. SYSU D8015 TaxID=2593644 RepID=UPI001CB73415|nr:ATP-binding protein [Nonomuraea sp. SYSU D8015]
MQIPKPADMFDRTWEWTQLTNFVFDEQPGAKLGVVSGRRRQGKTFLLDALCEATGGFYFAATEVVSAEESRRQLGEALGRHIGAPGPIHLTNWDDALDSLLALGKDRPIPVVLDEFPYTVRGAQELPSMIQRALSPRRRERRESRARILLCGSSISFMGNLLTGSAPLRGRAGMELTVPTFDFRLAREFWGLDDPRLAALVYLVLGGTPAYKTEYLGGAAPARVEDFDAWVIEHVLNPVSPLFREVRFLLAEDPTLRDTGLYHTVLAAVAEGNCTRGSIASRLERKATDISHHLTVLAGAGLLTSEPDAFRQNRSTYRITEPLVRFYHAIMRPAYGALERVRPGRTERIWKGARPRFRSAVAGPVFEDMCKTWARDMAAEETLGGLATDVLSGVVYDTSSRTSHEVDVVSMDEDKNLLAIGEAKWGDTLGMAHLERMEKIAATLKTRGQEPKVILLFSAAGFMPALQDAAAKSGGRVQLVDLQRLYAGE